MRQEPKLFSSDRAAPPPQDGFHVEPRHAPSRRHDEDDDAPVFRIPWRLLIAVAALLVAAVVAWQVIGWLGRGTAGTGDVPLFRAATEPFKHRPEEPGGLDVPNQDVTVYNALGTEEVGDGMEVLLPEPEEPVAIEPPAPEEAEGVVDVGAVSTAELDESTVAEPIFSADALALVVEGTPAPTSSTGLPLPQPRPQAPAPTEATVVEAATGIATDTTAGTATGTGVLSFDDVAAALGTDGGTGASIDTTTTVTETGTVIVTPEDELAAEVATETVVETTTVPVIATGTGDVWVQIAAYSTRADAEAAWQTLASRNADLLGQVSPRVTETQIAGATFHRLQVGTFASADQATTLCNALRQRQIDCVLVGP